MTLETFHSHASQQTVETELVEERRDIRVALHETSTERHLASELHGACINTIISLQAEIATTEDPEELTLKQLRLAELRRDLAKYVFILNNVEHAYNSDIRAVLSNNQKIQHPSVDRGNVTSRLV